MVQIILGAKSQTAEIKKLQAELKKSQDEAKRNNDARVDAEIALKKEVSRNNENSRYTAINHAAELSRVRDEAQRAVEVAKETADRRVTEVKDQARLHIENLESAQTIALTEARNELTEFEESFNSKLELAIAGKKKEMAKAEEACEKAHTDRMKKLESEYAAKVAKCDSELEKDKISYRRYLRGEFGKTIENLEKDNKRLFTENAILTGKNLGLEKTNSVLGSQIESVTEFADEIAGTLGRLSSDIADGLVKSVPEIKADFSTPENNFVGIGGATVQNSSKENKGGNNGGEQKK